MFHPNMLEHRFVEMIPAPEIVGQLQKSKTGGIFIFYPERHYPNERTGDFSAAIRFTGVYAEKYIEQGISAADICGFFNSSVTLIEHEQGHRHCTSIEVGVRATEFDPLGTLQRVEERFGLINKDVVRLIAFRRVDGKCVPAFGWKFAD